MELTKDKIKNILSMFNSNLADDKLLAFEIINNVDQKNNLIAILLIYKDSHGVSIYDWRKNCNEFFTNIIEPLNSKGIITFKDISSIINVNTTIDEIVLFKEAVEEFIARTVKKAGIDFIESLHIDFNDAVYKNKLAYDKDRVASQS